MNGYFERMVRAIASEHGIVDKFIGDAVMATFGGLLTISDPTACAYRAALGELTVKGRRGAFPIYGAS